MCKNMWDWLYMVFSPNNLFGIHSWPLSFGTAFIVVLDDDDVYMVYFDEYHLIKKKKKKFVFDEYHMQYGIAYNLSVYEVV